MFTMHLLQVMEKKFKREPQRVLNFRKQALEWSLIVMVITELKRLRDG